MNFTYEKSRDKHLTAKEKIKSIFSLSEQDGVLDAEFLSADRKRAVAFLGLPYSAPICLRLFSFPEFCEFIDSIEDDCALFEFFGKDITLRTEKESYDIPENVKNTIDIIIEKTQGLYWQQFINFVYSTYPIVTSERYTYLNLVQKATEYRQQLSEDEEQ